MTTTGSAESKAHLPRYSSPVSPDEMRAGEGAACIKFIHQRCRVTKTSIGGRSGSLIRVRRWQQREIYRMLAGDPETGRRKHRAGLLGVGRKNGKSGKASGIGLYLADTSDPGGEIYICASDREQAGIVGGVIKSMVRMDPYLSRRFKIYRNEIVIPRDDTRIKILSAEASTKDGYNPTAVIFDEVHAQPDAELWDAMALGMGARIDPLMLGITTAGKRYDRFGNDTLCYKLYEYGKQLAEGEIVDPTFYFTWWEPLIRTKKVKGEIVEEPVDHLDESVWAEGNPGLGDLVSIEDLRSVSKRTDEASFKTKRCNMWVSKAVSALPTGAWDSQVDRERFGRESGTLELTGGKRKVPASLVNDSVGFLDGSWSGDSTGVVNCTRDGFLFVTVHHERKQFDDAHWRIPVNSVKEDIIRMFEAGMRVLFLDPYRWQQTAQDLVDLGYPVVEWPTGSLPRICPAWKDYYAAVMEGLLSHDGDRAMARHHGNMTLKIDAKGSRPVKEHPTSVKHIDLAICAIGAYANRAVEVDVPKKVKPWVMTA